MTDLKSPRLIYLKAILFGCILLTSSILIIVQTQSWEIVFLLLLAIWSAARIYYFAFYVIEHYVDNQFKFSGLYSFFKYLVSRK